MHLYWEQGWEEKKFSWYKCKRSEPTVVNCIPRFCGLHKCSCTKHVPCCMKGISHTMYMYLRSPPCVSKDILLLFTICSHVPTLPLGSAMSLLPSYHFLTVSLPTTHCRSMCSATCTCTRNWHVWRKGLYPQLYMYVSCLLQWYILIVVASVGRFKGWMRQ